MRHVHLNILLMIVFAFLAACTSQNEGNAVEMRQGTSLQTIPFPELSTIDSLMWRRPDSALACLLPYFDTCCRDAMIASPEPQKGDSIETHAMRLYNRHYAQLLLAELLYKNDYAQTNRAELLQAVDFFDNLTYPINDHTHASWRHCGLDPQSPELNDNLIFLDARAHYINGVGYYEHDSVVEACEEYLKALEVMEDRFEEKELVGEKARFMAYTFTRLSDLFSDLYLHEQAIYYANTSLYYYHASLSPSWHSARMLAEIGIHYEITEKYDSAYYYYNQGKMVLTDTNNLIYRDIATHLASVSYKQGNPTTATLKQLSVLLGQAASEQEYASRCLTIGEVLFREQQYDSAWHYLNTVFCNSQSIGAKKQAAEWLTVIAKKQGKDANSLGYADFLIPFSNMEENQSGTKTQATSLDNAYKRAKLERENLKSSKRHSLQNLLIIGGMLIAMLIFYVLYKQNKRTKQRLESDMEAERHAHKMQQAALAGRLKKSNAALKANEDTSPGVSVFAQERSLNVAEKYYDEPICKHIIAACNDDKTAIKTNIPVSAYSHLALNDAQIAKLKEAALRHYGPLFERLKRQYPVLKEKDFYYCYLCLLGLDNAQIAVLQHKTISTIWERENRLKKIFGSEDKVSVILHGFMIN